MANPDLYAAQGKDAPSKAAKLKAGAELSEDTLATAFERRHRDGLRYCHTAGSWYTWDGARWKQERTRQAFTWARDICRELSSGDPKYCKASVAASVERFAIAA